MTAYFRVHDIEWERINLKITFELSWQSNDGALRESSAVSSATEMSSGAKTPDGLAVVAPEVSRIVITDTNVEHLVNWTILGNNQYLVCIQLSAFSGRQFLPPGAWTFRIYFSNGDVGEQSLTATCHPELFHHLKNGSRVFPYNERRHAYTVSFSISEKSPLPSFEMLVLNLKSEQRNDRQKEFLSVVILRNKFNRLLKATRLCAKKTVVRLIFNFYVLLHGLADRACNRDTKRVLFASSTNESMSGNLLSIYNRLREQQFSQAFDIRSSMRSQATTGVWIVLQQLRELACADVIVVDDYFSLFESIEVSPNACVVQVWHAGVGFKNVGYSRFGETGSPSLDSAHRQYSYAIAPSTAMVPVYAEAFGIESSSVIPTGMPRTDDLLAPSRHDEALRWAATEFPQLINKQIILFAPTFRGKDSVEAYYPYELLDLQGMYERCGLETVCVFHMHPFVQQRVPIPSALSDRLFDLSSEDQLANLMHISDLLITDYSSVIYDFALLNKPILFYAFDADEYSVVRGFHHDFKKTAPGKICSTFEEVLDSIEEHDFKTERLEKFRNHFFEMTDTGATDRVVQLITDAAVPEHFSRQVDAYPGSAGSKSTDNFSRSTQK